MGGVGFRRLVVVASWFGLALAAASCRPEGAGAGAGGSSEVFATQEELRDLIVTPPMTQGPFSPEAIALCEKWGVGKPCADREWSVAFLDEVRSYLDAEEDEQLGKGASGLNLDGKAPAVSLSLLDEKCPMAKPDYQRFAYGPFTQRAIQACEGAGGGKTCRTNCWNREFFEQIKRQVVRQPAPEAPAASHVSPSFGQSLAAKIRSMTVGFRGSCWKWVNDAIVRVTGHERRMFSHSKVFLDYARGNPGEVKRDFGLCLSPNRSSSSAPTGSVMVYSPGYCGFSRRWGHGEIKVGNDEYCSDGCMNTAARCPYPTAIFLPCGR